MLYTYKDVFVKGRRDLQAECGAHSAAAAARAARYGQRRTLQPAERVVVVRPVVDGGVGLEEHDERGAHLRLGQLVELLLVALLLIINYYINIIIIIIIIVVDVVVVVVIINNNFY
jgi:hypothetical protein